MLVKSSLNKIILNIKSIISKSSPTKTELYLLSLDIDKLGTILRTEYIEFYTKASLFRKCNDLYYSAKFFLEIYKF